MNTGVRMCRADVQRARAAVRLAGQCGDAVREGAAAAPHQDASPPHQAQEGRRRRRRRRRGQEESLSQRLDPSSLSRHVMTLQVQRLRLNSI